MGLQDLMRNAAEKVFGISKKEEELKEKKEKRVLEEHKKKTSKENETKLLVENQTRFENKMRKERRANFSKRIDSLKRYRLKVLKNKKKLEKVDKQIAKLERVRDEKYAQEKSLVETAKEFFIKKKEDITSTFSKKKEDSGIKDLKYDPQKYDSPAAKVFNLAKLDKIKEDKSVQLETLDEEKKKEEEESTKKGHFESQEKAEPDIFADTDTAEESVSHAINTLKSPENIKHFTELNDSEIKNLSALAAINNCTIKNSAIKAFIDEFENRRVSKDRKGRSEMVGIATAAFTGQIGDILAKSTMSRMMPAGLQKYMK